MDEQNTNSQFQATPEKTETPEVVETPAAPQAPQSNGQGFSIAGLVCGILGIIGGWIPVVCYFTTVCAILGLIFGVKGRKMSVAANGKASGLATAGMVLGIIGVAIAAVGLLCTALCSAALCSAASSL